MFLPVIDMAEKKKPDQAEIQQKMLQFQVLEGQLRATRAQIEQASARAEELTHAKVGLEGLEKVRPNDSAFIPMGAGNFIKGKIIDSSKVLMSMGGDIAIKKSRKQAIEILDSRLVEIQKMIAQLAVQEQKLTAALQKLQPEIQRALRPQ